MHSITVNLTDEQLATLREFGAEFNKWHLSEKDEPISDELAVLLCIMHTAVGPVRPNEWGACSLSGCEIGSDYPELVEFAKSQL